MECGQGLSQVPRVSFLLEVSRAEVRVGGRVHFRERGSRSRGEERAGPSLGSLPGSSHRTLGRTEGECVTGALCAGGGVRAKSQVPGLVSGSQPQGRG